MNEKQLEIAKNQFEVVFFKHIEQLCKELSLEPASIINEDEWTYGPMSESILYKTLMQDYLNMVTGLLR